MAAPQAPAGRKENVFTRHIGPLPMWVWLVIVGAVVVGWAWYRNRSQPASSVSGTSASQVPQFVNQTYTTVQPPSPPGSTTTDTDDTDTDDDDDRRKHKPGKHPTHRPVKRHHPTHHRKAGAVDVSPPPMHTGTGGLSGSGPAESEPSRPRGPVHKSRGSLQREPR